MAIYDNADIIARSRANESATMTMQQLFVGVVSLLREQELLISGT